VVLAFACLAEFDPLTGLNVIVRVLVLVTGGDELPVAELHPTKEEPTDNKIK
jgi:hypothetical protein